MKVNQDVFQKCWVEDEEVVEGGRRRGSRTEAPVAHKKWNTKQKKASRK